VPDAKSSCVRFVAREAYTVMYGWMGTVHAACVPVTPLKAMLGMPWVAAYDAAPTVPEISVVPPRFATRWGRMLATKEGQ